MAGNSRRRGAVRKTGSKKGATVGSGGQRRKGLEGKGPTPRAEERPNHKAYRAKGGAGGGSGAVPAVPVAPGGVPPRPARSSPAATPSSRRCGPGCP